MCSIIVTSLSSTNVWWDLTTLIVFIRHFFITAIAPSVSHKAIIFTSVSMHRQWSWAFSGAIMMTEILTTFTTLKIAHCTVTLTIDQHHKTLFDHRFHVHQLLEEETFANNCNKQTFPIYTYQRFSEQLIGSRSWKNCCKKIGVAFWFLFGFNFFLTEEIPFFSFFSRIFFLQAMFSHTMFSHAMFSHTMFSHANNVFAGCIGEIFFLDQGVASVSPQ